MSWSISKIGRATAVAAAVATEMAATTPLAEPEETARKNAADSIAKTLAEYPSDIVVRVEASGSQFSQSGGLINTCVLNIMPMFGFVE